MKRNVRKVYGLLLAVMLTVFCGCGVSKNSGNLPEDVLAAMEGGREGGYTVGELDWGMTEEEVKSAIIAPKEPESETDRLILQSSKNGLQLAEAYIFADETKSGLVTVEYGWTADSDEEFRSVVKLLCSFAAQKMGNSDSGEELTENMLFEMGTAVWTASDNSMVNIMCLPEQKTIAVQIHGPREVPKTLMSEL